MKPSPCKDCVHQANCGGWTCDNWIKWFRETWREIQLVADMKKRGIKV